MEFSALKGSYRYATKNIYFLIFVLFLQFLILLSIDYDFTYGVWGLFASFILMGYGLQVTKDVIDGGTRLPKIMPKKLLGLGVKGFIVALIYFSVQGFILFNISSFLGFPEFELEDLLVHLQETIHMVQEHDPVNSLLFFILGIAIFYVFTFFMEIALARLADGGSILDAFNFPKIKKTIDIIGWKDYTIEYTEIILSIVVLTVFSEAVNANFIIDDILQLIFYMWMFIIEFRGIGVIYKVYIDNKAKLEKK